MEADPIQVALLEGALPPGGRKELFRLQSIRLRPAGELIGFLGTYHGFPDAETLWIVVLAFDPRFQRQGYGTELVGELGELAVGLGTFTRMRGFICLGNLPALRFFVQAGFDRIVTVADDPDPPHEAHVMLEKRLA
jgi:GNAT superfamily N-acetyltransferase